MSHTKTKDAFRLPTFRVDSDGGLSPEALGSWQGAGCLVIENFFDECARRELIWAADSIVAQFDMTDRDAIFSTQTHEHARNKYFETSGDKIRCFFEENALNQNGDLLVPKEQSINKIGHALHDLHPVFERFSYQPRIVRLMQELGIDDPRLLQSMFIFKQPGIGGEVNWHQDGSFLYTAPLSVTGLWFALEDATLENGCLWALPGQHTRGLRSRFLRVNGELIMEDSFSPPTFDEDQAVPLEVAAGTLIIIHGALPHYSAPNRSQKSRYAYTLHAISGTAAYPEDNWLQRDQDLPLRRLTSISR